MFRRRTSSLSLFAPSSTLFQCCGPPTTEEGEDHQQDSTTTTTNTKTSLYRPTSSTSSPSSTSTTWTSTRDPNRPMLTEYRRKLMDSTYSLVGTSSAVKICRWTKSMIRGQGGCYKHCFYNIASYKCVECTPSVGCANKCTFCWRGSKHPTIKDWNFAVDEPTELVEKIVDTHAALIRDLKGLPGAKKERIEEAQKPAHCALSLVGEPIAYPRISEFCTELHKRGISSFLVNNGQFPEQLQNLTPVCQLYLSVDAMQRDKMKELDRPIFPDFWERHEKSIAALAPRKERTVFRLTMIEGYNMADEDIERLVQMVKIGQPGLIELKQMTAAFHGRDNIPLRITNVPRFRRLVEFAKKLVEALGSDRWAIPCVHEHSRCILVADKSKFFDKDGQKWKTWIDFEKFTELVLADPEAKSWSFADYQAETPKWALLPNGDNNIEMSETDDCSLQAEVGDHGRGQLEHGAMTMHGLGFDPEQSRFYTARQEKALARKRAQVALEKEQQQQQQEQQQTQQLQQETSS